MEFYNYRYKRIDFIAPDVLHRNQYKLRLIEYVAPELRGRYVQMTKQGISPAEAVTRLREARKAVRK